MRQTVDKRGIAGEFTLPMTWIRVGIAAIPNRDLHEIF
jgi:hypothetical protein